MKVVFEKGDKKYHTKIVTEKDLASFGSGNVHAVCSTFALAREMEWASRLFVLEMLEKDEEGIGTKLEISHKSPALVSEELKIEAVVHSVDQHEIICDISVIVGSRLIAKGMTGQKVLKKSKIESLINNIK